MTISEATTEISWVALTLRVRYGKQGEIAMALKKTRRIDWQHLIAKMSYGKTVLEPEPKRHIYMQGDPADSVFFLQRGRVKHSVTSKQGKEAIVAVLDAGDFFGEGCLAGQPLRMATVTAMTPCTLVRIEKPAMVRMLQEQHDVSALLITHLLSRNIRYEEDLVDQLFNSSELRLARILLLLAHFGKDSRAEKVVPRIDHESLAQMVGTTRSRISHFMTKFRKLGFIKEDSGLTVHRGLLSVVLHDQRRSSSSARYHAMSTGCSET